MIAAAPLAKFVALAGIVALLASALRAERYVALMRDGSTRHGKRLELDEQRSPRLDGKPLLDQDNPVHVLRNTIIAPAAPGPRIELVNGDALSGRVIGVATGPAAAPWPDYLLVDSTAHSGQVRVRLDWVRTIVAHRRGAANLSPGVFRVTDGREISSRSLRWADDGVKALTNDGIVHVPWEQITELSFPQPHARLPPLPGAALLAGDHPGVVRMQTADGDVTTIPRAMITDDFDTSRRRAKGKTSPKLLATRPPWALNTILFDPEAISFQTYLMDDEWPLSLLEVIDVQQKSAVQHLPWRRNRNVHGGVLESGEIAVELGIGMHSHCRLTFALPPGARRFTSQVGLDRTAGGGGCVHCRIYLDGDPTPRWQREYLRGGDGLQTVEPIDVAGAKTLTLEVDFADKDRPDGADPLDIRDWVNWLLPTVILEPARGTDDVARLVPELAGWTVPPDSLPHVSLRPVWLKKEESWGMAIDGGDQPLVLSRPARIDLTHAWLLVQAARNDKENSLYEVHVAADGQKVSSTMNGGIRTYSSGKFTERVYILHACAGKDIQLDVTVEKYRKDRGDGGGIVFGPLRLQPLIRNLPDDGRPIEPDVPLTALTPVRAVHHRKSLTLLPGKVSEQLSLNVRDWPFASGYGVPTGSEITYTLDPAWRMFVAVIGLAEGWHGAGPYEILLDGKPHWASATAYARDDQGEQIAVPIPQGHQTITLRVLGQESSAAFAHAGFTN